MATPFRLNALLSATGLAILFAQVAIIPLVLLPQSPLFAGAAVLLLALTTPFNNALMHEAIHGRLARNPAVNDALGRSLAIFSGVTFDIIRFGHMTHHRFNRHALDRPDVMEPNQNRAVAFLQYYFGLLGGLYLREMAVSIAMFLPRRLIEWAVDRALAKDAETVVLLRSAVRRMLSRRLTRIRVDTVIAITVFAGAFYLYGAAWPWLAAAIAMRGVIVSMQDNLPHYGTPAIIGAAAHNSRTSAWARAFMLNQNFHDVHHRQPELPWNALPQAFALTGANYGTGYFSLAAKQLRGPWRPAAGITESPSP